MLCIALKTPEDQMNFENLIKYEGRACFKEYPFLTNPFLKINCN